MTYPVIPVIASLRSNPENHHGLLRAKALAMTGVRKFVIDRELLAPICNICNRCERDASREQRHTVFKSARADRREQSEQGILLKSVNITPNKRSTRKIKKTDPTKENQKGFEKMIAMEYRKKAFGTIKLTVGVKRGTKEKIQYCVTAIENG